jgi:RNA polymerase sigma-70 factor (ECF subfamily)
MSVTAFKSETLPQDIERIFNEHHIFVYKVAYHILGNRQEAEDVVQTIFLRLLGRERPPDIRRNPRAYLHRSAVNIAINILHQRGRHVSDEAIESRLHDRQPSQERQFASSEVQAWFRTALAKLNSRAAEIFILKHVEGYDNAEIAKLLGTTRGTVAVTLFRARVQLKKSIRTLIGDRK